MTDKTEFRIGRSHDDIVYHHVAGRDFKSDPRYAVCATGAEAKYVMTALNKLTQTWVEEDFQLAGLRW